MLICPQCQFENPNTNNFCQNCGTSLTQKVCAECGMNVALSEERCPNCDAKTGTVWWAIVFGSRGVGEYLDAQRRYEVLESFPVLQEAGGVQVRVLDCQPLQPSPLEANAKSLVEMPIPAIAKTYLTLQSQLHQALPAIHDAWQQGEQQVLLIADRSDWSKLVDVWHDNKTTLPQILQWLSEMSKLWTVLEPWHCRQSLLELSNLRVDEKQRLALQRLYADEKLLTLQDLGRVWERLLQESPKTLLGSLAQLLADLQAGSIPTIDSLQSRLEAIMAEQKIVINPTPDLPPETAEREATKKTEVATPTILQLDEPQESLDQSDEPTVMLSLQLSSLEDAGRTDVGQQRDHNEDFFGIETAINKIESPNGRTIQARGLYLLCDGMGGHAGGEVASALAIETLKQYFQTSWQQQLPTEDTIREAVRLANQTIYDLNQKDARSGVGRMGTTLVMVLVQGTQVAVAHVGDSRLYKLTLRQGLKQVTVDHEVGQREISRGIEPELAYARADAYQLTQALGPRDENFISPDVQFLQLTEDTLLLLVSDGLSDNNLVENFCHTHLEPLLTGVSLEQGVSDLIDLANDYNGHDNITAIVIRAKVLPDQS